MCVINSGDHILRAVCSKLKYVSIFNGIQSILEIKHLRLDIREPLYNVIKTKVIEQKFLDLPRGFQAHFLLW